MEGVLVYLTVIIGIAAIFAVIARLVRQPPIIAYIFVGILVGPLFLNMLTPSSSDVMQMFAHLGVAFLLFIVGLSLDVRVLKEVGKVSVFGGLIEISLTSSIGFLIALAFGFPLSTCIYLGVALAFSSTVVVVKILSDKKEIDTLHGRIALGILIVEDFVAAVALMIVPLLGESITLNYILSRISFIILIALSLFFMSNFILGKFMNYLARSQEALFLFGIAWALVLALIFDRLGFSMEIGALVAGVAIASSKYNLELSSKMKPLRDFFIVLFFVFFGSQITSINSSLLGKAVIFFAFILIGKPIIVMSVLRFFGYRKRTNFLAGTSLAQISEFSLILALIGYSLGQIPQEVMSLIVLIYLITIGLSSYSIYYSNWIFARISKFLTFFEGEEQIGSLDKKNYDIVLLGYHRLGYKILKRLKKMNANFVIVDYNPKVVLSLGERGYNCIYGDAADHEFLREIGLEKAKLIVSTIPDDQINLYVKEYLTQICSKAVFLATTDQPRNALDLYRKGIDYVLIPHHLGGEYAANMIEKFLGNKEKYKVEGKKHIKELLYAKKDSKFTEGLS